MACVITASAGFAAFTAAVPAEAATTIACENTLDAVCFFDGVSGGWTNVNVSRRSTATQAFALTLPYPGTLYVSISSTYLDLVSISFGGVTLKGLYKSTPYAFAATGSNTPQLLTVVMKNTKSSDHGYNAQLDFAADSVPEPAAWGLMIGGFALAGATARRRRRIPATAA